MTVQLTVKGLGESLETVKESAAVHSKQAVGVVVGKTYSSENNALEALVIGNSEIVNENW
jgi:hypothetical protein